MQWKRLIGSFKAAGRGLAEAFKREQNFRLEIVALIIVFAGSLVFRLTSLEVVIIFLLAGLVLVTELVNTAVEHLLDWVKPRLAMETALIKEVMAAATLIAAVVAFGGGILIFFPHFMSLLK